MAGYLGGKVKLAKYIIPIMLKNRKEGQYYVEPFCGACGVLKEVAGKMIANDINHFLIALYKHMQNGFDILDEINKEEYNKIIHNITDHPEWLVGQTIFVSKFGCFLSGWAALRSGCDRTLSKRVLLKDIATVLDVEFFCVDYRELNIPQKSIIYCDPPYFGVGRYRYNNKFGKKFENNEFNDWCVEKKTEGHEIFISEYAMPVDRFECIFEVEITRGAQGKNRKLVERLFIPK